MSLKIWKNTLKIAHNWAHFFSIANRPKTSPNLIFHSIKMSPCATFWIQACLQWHYQNFKDLPLQTSLYFDIPSYNWMLLLELDLFWVDIAEIWIEKIWDTVFQQSISHSIGNFSSHLHNFIHTCSSKKNNAEGFLKNDAKMLIEIQMDFEARFTFHVCHQH